MMIIIITIKGLLIYHFNTIYKQSIHKATTLTSVRLTFLTQSVCTWTGFGRLPWFGRGGLGKDELLTGIVFNC